MDSKETIMEAAISLIEEKGDCLEEITMREISKRAGVGLGLINYHFENKEKLIELCVERIINGIVEKFRGMKECVKDRTPFEKLDALGNMTLTFLFEHRAVSKISILSDMRFPQEYDNTRLTMQAYLPLVADCRPDWDEEKVYQMTYCLISCMQSVFLRADVLLQTRGIDLRNAKERSAFYTKMLKNIVSAETEERTAR
ncbi:MAG: TetR/AcrR family transcriptional regulator [Lachnospiraceae bacterium]|nr:TetR/AcrR family transcriptional regulator [Lachnospiraceae bacterium]